jgi:hypothetical protein
MIDSSNLSDSTNGQPHPCRDHGAAISKLVPAVLKPRFSH